MVATARMLDAKDAATKAYWKGRAEAEEVALHNGIGAWAKKGADSARKAIAPALRQLARVYGPQALRAACKEAENLLAKYGEEPAKNPRPRRKR